ncbi:MAG: M20/M25/M40 family metallo-hydrolase [Micrococcus sp.]|nr:M20/M25/M40 family metallo-hydrolase [Micrococcus sp.]
MTRSPYLATVRRSLGRSRRGTIAIVASGAIALLVSIGVATQLAGDAGRHHVHVSPAYEHLMQFQALAEEHGDRALGTAGYEAAAEYVEEQLASAGYETTRQYFTFERRGEDYESFNVIAQTPRGDDENVIMLGAHLDGVPGSPAINDNASGAAALLEAARELSRQDRVNTTVRFVWWGAEEARRSPGSRHYVEELDEDDELEHILAYLNFDMVASPNPIIGIYDARDTGASLDIPEGSVEIMRLFADYFDARGQPWVATEWDFRSDQVPFAREDVPVGGLFTGSDEPKSGREAALFGGRADAPRDPNYHSPGDDIDNVDLQTLDLMTEAITHVAATLAEDSSVLE